MKIQDKLKPCPFCGGTHVVLWGKTGAHRFVFCQTCATSGPLTNKKKAIAKWNTRAAVKVKKTKRVSKKGNAINRFIMWLYNWMEGK